MPADDTRPGSGAGSTSASDPNFEQTLRVLLDRTARSVTAPAGLAARVHASELPRRRRRRRAFVVGAAALATSSVLLAGLAAEEHFTSGGGLSVIMPADGETPPLPATGTPTNPGVPPTGIPSLSPDVTGTPPDPATADEITRAFTEAFDADDNVDDGLAYVQNGTEYHDITVRFGQKYPGVVGNLRVGLENITMTTDNAASATIVLTHTDPKLGGTWGYEIRRGVGAVRVNGRWLVSGSTYSFLVGTA